ncbi:endonuclease [Bacillus mycoides]|nr:endonuclease [Bacillus mycoides]
MINKNRTISLVGREYGVKDISPLSSSTFRDLVKRRALSILDLSTDEKDWIHNEELRKETEKKIFEKIHKNNNLLPISFLSKGVDKAKAICKITTPSGSMGTGFLIDNGIIMTNHHVIENEQMAEGSFAEFYYEEDKSSIKVFLKPNKLFITSPMDDLDFTIVSCETVGIEDIKPIKLTRNPDTVTRGEYVNIIQHPSGRKKELALQDNNVSYVYDKVIHYITDTEPGSSGSAVFNNTWQLVALHHAGWYTNEGEKLAINEGIRISVIVSKLIALAQSGDESASRVVDTLEDTSPYLGFYDVSGLIDNNNDLLEVEVPTYKGDKRFADVGFWNIEHFNNNISNQKLNKVAKIVSGLSMDALGLVEVEKGALDRLVQELRSSFGANMDYVYFDADGSQDLAIIYDTYTTNVELREDINLKYRSLLSSTTASGKTAFPNKREPLFAKCTIKEEGKDTEFLMIVVHLKAMRDRVSIQRRKLASKVISVIIENLQQDEEFKNLPIILGGDLNDDVPSDSLQDLLNSPALLNLTLDDASAGHLSYLKSPYSLIDHIFISKDMKVGTIQNDDAAIVRLDRSISDFVQDISDHAPLVMRIIYGDSNESFKKLNKSLGIFNNIYEEEDYEKTLLRLKLNQERFENEDEYYNEEKDKFLINSYYNRIDFNINDNKKLYHKINELLTSTHVNILSYSRSKKELHSLVDLREDGTTQSIYSGKSINPEELIRADALYENQKRTLIENLMHNKQFLTDSQKEQLLELFECNGNCNIEHVVPRSWFGNQSTMEGDLHHLFICESTCNSFRSNVPYYDFSDYNPEAYTETVRTECGKKEQDLKFEPNGGKGEVARAVLYFLLRYPHKINNSKKRIDIELLLKWHEEHPVTLHEKHRNVTIFKLQGNRNPLIDYPECANLINFSLGL